MEIKSKVNIVNCLFAVLIHIFTEINTLQNFVRKPISKQICTQKFKTNKIYTQRFNLALHKNR